jgi:glycosyltransferase involved in cell wall biosynthesis
MLSEEEQNKAEYGIAFVSSAFNEEENLEELYRRCLQSFEEVCGLFPACQFEFSMILVDNSSLDRTPEVIQRLIRLDPRVKGIRNIRNYGPEASFMQGLRLADSDLIVMLCADLQDPPEVARQMLQQLIGDPLKSDAVFGCKRRSAGSPLIQSFRKLYYLLLSFSDRDTQVLPGFHGFGCYRKDVIHQALDFWTETAMNLRQCLASASISPGVVNYVQPNRLRGKSSYRLMGYVQEAGTGIITGKSLASRLSLRLGFTIFLASILVGVFILVNFATGRSGYAQGVPTLALLILLSSSFQMIMLSFVSRQIENGLHQPLRPTIRYRSL